MPNRHTFAGTKIPNGLKNSKFEYRNPKQIQKPKLRKQRKFKYRDT